MHIERHRQPGKGNHNCCASFPGEFLPAKAGNNDGGHQREQIENQHRQSERNRTE